MEKVNSQPFLGVKFMEYGTNLYSSELLPNEHEEIIDDLVKIIATISWYEVIMCHPPFLAFF